MIPYATPPLRFLELNKCRIASFLGGESNIDWKTVHSFGDEWQKFKSFEEAELAAIGDAYFDIVPENALGKDKVALDVGCGSGRWSRYLADKVGYIEAVDPSHSIVTASEYLAECPNVRVTQAAAESLPFQDSSFDFVFSLGVLHHIPNTAKALASCASKLKPGGYFLGYFYYDFEQRGVAFRTLFKIADAVRRVISALPSGPKHAICDLIALLVYWPLSRLSGCMEAMGLPSRLVARVPLSFYRDKSFQILKNDALDRFGTRLEQRFSRAKITEMMRQAGLTDVVFSPKEPYWHFIGRKQPI